MPIEQSDVQHLAKSVLQRLQEEATRMSRTPPVMTRTSSQWMISLPMPQMTPTAILKLKKPVGLDHLFQQVVPLRLLILFIVIPFFLFFMMQLRHLKNDLLMMWHVCLTIRRLTLYNHQHHQLLHLPRLWVARLRLQRKRKISPLSMKSQLDEFRVIQHPPRPFVR